MHLLSDHAATNRKKYVACCRKYVRHLPTGRSQRSFRTSHVYALRCAFLHNGTTRLLRRHNRSRGYLGVVRLVWESPEPRPSIVFAMTTRGFAGRRDLLLQMDAAVLCQMHCDGVRLWLASTALNRNVRRNSTNLIGIDFRIPGLPPR